MLYSLTDASASVHTISNPHDVVVTLMAGADVPIQAEAVKQALRVTALAPVLAATGGELQRMLLTPDLHRGAQVPVGMVFDTRGALIPGAIGNDIGCGMRLAVLDDVGELDDRTLDRVGARLREVFFCGQRNLPLLPADRLAVLEHGLPGLLESSHVQAGAGAWSYVAERLDEHVRRAHGGGGFPAGGVDAVMAAWARESGKRDSQIGSLGGGNHFCELQRVVEVVDGPTAWSWGLRVGALAVMTHTGSLGFGHRAAGSGHRAALAQRLPGVPEALLPLTDPSTQSSYLQAMRNAANLAFANRLALTAMALSALGDVLGGDLRWVTVGDAPHNLIWPHEDGFRHRKGACPADGPMSGPYVYTGDPVLIPGSVGDSSWVLAGSGNEELLSSACHGAGRALARGLAARTHDDAADHALRVITPSDPRALAAAGRRDLLTEHARRVREEAPRAYKPVDPVVDAVVNAGAARKVARLAPLLTVKGA